jgi:hypothetical protein
MKKRAISLIATTALFVTIGALGAPGAQAETRLSGPSTIVSPIVAKPNFVPPTDGGVTSPAPSNPSQGSAGQQVCYVVRVVLGFATVWETIGKVSKWVQIPVYGSNLVCTILKY